MRFSKNTAILFSYHFALFQHYLQYVLRILHYLGTICIIVLSCCIISALFALCSYNFALFRYHLQYVLTQFADKFALFQYVSHYFLTILHLPSRNKCAPAGPSWTLAAPGWPDQPASQSASQPAFSFIILFYSCSYHYCLLLFLMHSVVHHLYFFFLIIVCFCCKKNLSDAK